MHEEGRTSAAESGSACPSDAGAPLPGLLVKASGPPFACGSTRPPSWRVGRAPIRAAAMRPLPGRRARSPPRRHAAEERVEARPGLTDVPAQAEPARALPYLTGLPWRRNSTDLVQQAKGVTVYPDLVRLAAYPVRDGNPCCRHLLACRWNAPKIPRMGPPRC